MSFNHIHITLVGGAPMPVYQGIVYCQPDKVILVCSDSTFEQAVLIKKELQNQPSFVEIREFPYSDYGKLCREVENLANEDQVKEAGTVSLNLSGGLKIWSLSFYSFFSKNFHNLLSFCLGQDGIVYNLTKEESIDRVIFDMEAQFRLLGNEIDSYTSFKDYTAEDIEEMHQVEKMYCSRNHDAFKRLADAFLEKASQKNKDIDDIIKRVNDTSLSWDPGDRSFSIDLSDKEMVLKAPHAWHILLNTGWFEVFVADWLAQVFERENIRLNCIFKSRNQQVKNEVDIIVDAGTKLLFVECKTQVKNSTDVDKFASVVRTYGGLGSKALFVTYSPMVPEALEKCEEKGIAVFDCQGLLKKDKEKRVPSLKKMIDGILKSSNPK